MTSYTEQLELVISEIKKIDRKNLISRPEWGSANFERAQNDIELSFDYIDTLSALNFNNIPEQEMHKLVQAVSDLKQSIHAIDTFNITNNRASDTNTYANNLKRSYTNLYHIFFPLIASIAYFSDGKTSTIADVEERCKDNLKKIEEVHTEINSTFQQIDIQRVALQQDTSQLKQDILTDTRETQKEIQRTLSKTSSDAKELLEDLRGEVAKKASSEFTEFYSGEASKCQKASYGWIFLTFILGIITLYVSGLFSGLFDISYILSDSCTDEVSCFLNTKIDHAKTWQDALPRTAFIGVLIGMTIWCGRVTRALMHQRTINTHRAKSIQTLGTFYKSATDQHAKDAVVVEAARAAFGNVPSGFIGNHDNQNASPEMQIMNFTKEISKNT